MMIMLRSTRLCVYNKVLVPFEASFFFVFGAKTKTKFFFFSPACILGCHHRSVGLIFFFARRFFLSPHKPGGKNALSLLRARERTTRRRTSTHLISRPVTFNSRASNTLGACVARSRREIKKNNTTNSFFPFNKSLGIYSGIFITQQKEKKTREKNENK